jgi:hypothetical protein
VRRLSADRGHDLAMTGSTPAASSSPTGSPLPTASSSSSVPSSAPVSPSPKRTVDVAGATRVALTLFKRSPLSLNDPSAGYIWTSVPWTAGGGPHSDAVKARLAGLNSGGYFDDRHCAESYVDGTRNGLLTQPKVLRGARTRMAASRWSCAVGPHTPPTSGTGPPASIFSAKPNC